jgi:hypothetical protein
MSNPVKKIAVDAIRAAGHTLEVAGRAFEKNAFVETIQPSMRSVALGGAAPATSGFVASTATVIGKVKMGNNSSVWYGAVVRGEFVFFRPALSACMLLLHSLPSFKTQF